MDGLRPMNAVASQITQDTGQCNRQEYWAQQIPQSACSNPNWQSSDQVPAICNQVENVYDYHNGNGQGQLNTPGSVMASLHQHHAQANAHYPGPVIGLQALCAACARLYPDQLNPLQVTARIKYWLGGPDPLDYISMFWNTGRPDLNVPPHWHYVSFGLSDLHGDGRVHPPPTGPLQPDQPSGLGLELSFRVVGEPGRPPTWPAALLQRLATYVFKTGNRLCVGDHVSWHSALDGSDEVLTAQSLATPASANNPQQQSNPNGKRKLKIRHMLIAQDQQFGTVDTPLGKVQFVQVVGVTDRELKAAQRSGGSPILDMLAADPACGGGWLVTNLERSHSVSLPSSNHLPSELSGVAAVCKWEPWISSQDPLSPNYRAPCRETSEIPSTVKEQIKCVLQKGLSGITPHSSKDFPVNFGLPSSETMSKDRPKINEDNMLNECKMSTDSVKFSLTEDQTKDRSDFTTDSLKMPFNVQKDVAMSTDSFEMSKIEHALLEEVMNLPANKSSDPTDAIKKESSETDQVRVKLEVKTEQTNNNTNAYQNNTCTIRDNGNSYYPCACGQAEYITESNKHDKNEAEQDPVEICKRCGGRPSLEPRSEKLQGVHLIFDKEAGSLLPLALRGRVLHGRHFTWTAVGGSQAVTLVPPSVSGAIVSLQNPIATANDWLQVLIPEDFAKEMAEQLELVISFDDEGSDEENESRSQEDVVHFTPNTFCWPHRGLKITIGDKA